MLTLFIQSNFDEAAAKFVQSIKVDDGIFSEDGEGCCCCFCFCSSSAFISFIRTLSELILTLSVIVDLLAYFYHENRLKIIIIKIM